MLHAVPAGSNSSLTFASLPIEPKLKDILAKNNYITPTPIQEKVIPVATQGVDVMGIAQTGTGKTLAFGIPLMERLLKSPKGRALIVLPTRELALQVDETMQKLARPYGMHTAVLIGGASFSMQRQILARNPRILIVTPGRLIDHLDRNTIRLHDINALVLDEADRMLDMGFEPQIRRILQTVPKERQTMLFSATMPQEITGMATSYMRQPTRIEVARAGTAATRVTQEIFFVSKETKIRLLERLLQQYTGTVLVFMRTKFAAKKITHTLRNKGVSAAEIHSNRSLAQRQEALKGFKTGKYRVLVATDIAARGIDVTGIELVVNFDLPDQTDDYVHRIGRTGRAGMTGHAISFATPDQRRDVRDIERLTRQTLKVSPVPTDLPAPSQTITPKPFTREAHQQRSFQHRPFQQRGATTHAHASNPRGTVYARAGKPTYAPHARPAHGSRPAARPFGFVKARPQAGDYEQDSYAPRTQAPSTPPPRYAKMKPQQETFQAHRSEDEEYDSKPAVKAPAGDQPQYFKRKKSNRFHQKGNRRG